VAEPLSGAYNKYEQQACLSFEQVFKKNSCLYYLLQNCYNYSIIVLPEKSAKTPATLKSDILLLI